MRCTSALLVCLVACASVTAAEDAPALTVRPIQIIACEAIPAEVPFEVKPMLHDPGFRISYLVEGRDLIGFKDDSVVIDSMITPDGRDISKKPNGEPTYKMMSFPKAADDGKFGVFQVECSDNQFGKVEQLAITGRVIALTGTKSTKGTVELALDDKAPQTLGIYKVSPASGKPIFGGDGSGMGITVSGELDRIIAITASEGGKELERSGSAGSDHERTYSFAKAAGKTVSLTITWWEDRTERPVSFAHGVAKK
ncbi:MAG: hypothetical protein H0V44_07565 [Planctomycetes bacterium]|nr:hypothetical protein [Planctomycetota bacterium]